MRRLFDGSLPVRVAPLAVWLVVQVGAVALAASRVPLAADWPDPAERVAPHALLAAQVVAAALLFPWLLAGRRSLAVVAATAVPMTLAAGHLAFAPVGRSLLIAGWLAAWLLDLALLRSLLPRSGRWDGAASAAVNLLAVGPVGLLYLLADFAPPAPGTLASAIAGALRLAPLPATGAVSAAPSTAFFEWLALFSPALLLAAARLARRPRSADTLSTPPVDGASA